MKEKGEALTLKMWWLGPGYLSNLMEMTKLQKMRRIKLIRSLRGSLKGSGAMKALMDTEDGDEWQVMGDEYLK